MINFMDKLGQRTEEAERRGSRRGAQDPRELGRKYEDILKRIENLRNRALNLQEVLDERERAADSLQEAIAEREARLSRIDAAIGDSRELEQIIDVMEERLSLLSNKMGQNFDALDNGILQNFQEMNNSIQKNFGEIKGELSEQIHKENIKCYRNLQSLLEESQTRQDQAEGGATQKQYHVIKVFLGVITFVTVVNLTLSILALLKTFGIF